MTDFIQAKAEAWAMHNWYRLSGWNWFAAGQRIRGDLGWPTKIEYRDQVVEWARHVYKDTGDPEQDTGDAVNEAIRNMTKVLRANSIKDKITQATSRGRGIGGGLSLYAPRPVTTTDFNVAINGGVLESRWLTVYDPDPMPKLLVDEVLATLATHPKINDKQRNIYRAWLSHGLNAEAAARELGVSREWVRQTRNRVNGYLRQSHPSLVVEPSNINKV